MKKSITFFLLLGLLAFTGCKDKEAREYAAQLADVLQRYAEQVAVKIKAEETSYKESEKLYGAAREEEVFEVIRYERIERTNRTVDTLAASLGHKPRASNPELDRFAPLTLAQVQEDLRQYGQFDFEMTRQSLEQELSARKRYLNHLDSLQFELARVKALQSALRELAQAKNAVQQLKDLTAFMSEANKAYNQLACDDLTEQMTALETRATSLTKRVAAVTGIEQEKLQAKLAAVKKEIADLQQRKQKRSCP